jgi:hypothetical protein
MTSSPLIERLAERCEQATDQYQRRLLSETYRELFGGPDTIIISRWPGYISPRWDSFHKMLEAEAFLDAAMTLIPAGWVLSQLGINGKRDKWSVLLWVDDEWTDLHPNAPCGDAATPALAICAAALRAKATS